MKKLTSILLLLFPALSFAQYNDLFMPEFFFVRQPGARSEAMGKTSVAVDGDMTTTFFNPAGAATIQGVDINGSTSTPAYLVEKGRYSFLSVACKPAKKFALGISRNHFSFGKLELTNENGESLGYHKPYDSNYALTLACEPLKNWLVGLNANVLFARFRTQIFSTFYSDLGIIKKINLFPDKKCKHSLNIGGSIVNLNYARLKSEIDTVKFNDALPVIARLGAGYSFSTENILWKDTLKAFSFLGQVEYQDVINGKYRTAIRAGAEIKVSELLAIRIGYFTETQNNFTFSEVNYNNINSFTYGFGIQVPLNKLADIPLLIALDYTSLKQPEYSNAFKMDNFNTFNIRLNFLPKGK